MKAQDLLNSLLVIVNTSPHETNDTLIARALLENRETINSMSMDQMAAKYHISQPTISRFVKKMGYRNFSELRQGLALSDYYFKFYLGDRKPDSAEAAIETVHKEITEAVDEIRSADVNDLMNLVEKIRKADKIVFMGSELSMSILRILQHQLLTVNKTVYTILLPSYQKEILPSLDEKTLLICVSVADRWLQHMDAEELKKCRCTKVLLCGHDCEYRQKGFDKMIRFSHRGDNMSYNSLMAYVQVLHKLL